MVNISKIERSKRKTLSVAITPNGEVVVKAPLNLPEYEIYKFLDEKRSWIESKLNRTASIQEKFKKIINYEQLLVFGKMLNGYSSGNVSQITLKEDRILFPAKITTKNIHKKVLNWYKILADSVLISRTMQISSQVGIKIASVKCTGSRGRWGACNNSKQIFLNWRCVMLPKELIDYVIVHELAHILELNHSPKFWAVVGQILPDFKTRRQQLKQYGFALRLF